jgi:assimilatory nitrate reductase electron transfer subunit
MVAHRLLDELVRLDTSASWQIDVVGAEPYAPYNRLLLGEVLAGRQTVAGLVLPNAPTRVRVHAGRSAVGLDLERGWVVDDAGTTHPFDRVVLATGAAATIPALPGLREPGGRLRPSAHVLRSLDDCRDLRAATTNARSALVLGGGLLGVEAAVALAGRGLAVTLAHRGATLLDRQFDDPAGTTVTGAVADLGIDVRTGVRPTHAVTSAGRVTGIAFADGSAVTADLILLSCGVEPRTDLAVEAGLPVGRGVLIDAHLTSPGDPRVAAIGDCAEPVEGCTGLVAAGWRQAERLARLLSGADAEHPDGRGPTGDPVAGAGEVVRIKAHGLDVVTMGSTSSTGSDGRRIRVLTLDDPESRRYVRVAIDDGRVVGATCVGAGTVAVDLLSAFDRGSALPVDPALLMVNMSRGESAASDSANGSPTRMPDDATVCRCNGVPKRAVVAAWQTGARDVAAVAEQTRATTGCGGCAPVVDGLLDWLRASTPDVSPDVAPDLPGKIGRGRRAGGVDVSRVDALHAPSKSGGEGA